MNYRFGFLYSRDYPEREDIQSYFRRRTVVFGMAVNLWFFEGGANAKPSSSQGCNWLWKIWLSSSYFVPSKMSWNWLVV